MRAKTWLAFLFLLASSFAFALDQTSTGFYYPIGTENYESGGGTWLGRDTENGGGYPGYFAGYYHVGVDMMTRSTDAEVFAIADGQIVNVDNGADSWGVGNCGVFVRHEKANGDDFIALYGHLICTTIPSNPGVLAGQSLGRTGNYPGGIHLHFGIHDGSYATMAKSGWGKMPNTAWNSPNTFTDPIAFIRNNAPRRIDPATIPGNAFQVYKIGNYAWYPSYVSCIKASFWYGLNSKGELDTAYRDGNICTDIYEDAGLGADYDLFFGSGLLTCHN